MKREHEDRVQTIRRAYQQQLADALARIGKLYAVRIREKMRKEKEKLSKGVGNLEDKIKELKDVIQRNETSMEMLQLQCEKLQRERDELKIRLEYPMDDESEFTVESEENQELIAAQAEVQGLKESLTHERSLNERHLANIKAEQDSNRALKGEIEKLKVELTQNKATIHQLNSEKELLQDSMAGDHKMAVSKLEKEKEEIRKEIIAQYEEKLKKAQQETADAIRESKNLSLSNTKDSDLKEARLKNDQLTSEITKLQQMLNQEKQKSRLAAKDAGSMEHERMMQDRLKAEVNRLKREMDKMQKSWEKKFAIMKQSMHALKDESYLRQNLQKQAANLHQASISYAVDTPDGIMGTKSMGPNRQRKLPPVSRSEEKKISQDLISYTVSAQSGRQTGIFSRLDENQVMSDNEEDLPEDIVPISPHRRPPTMGEVKN
ncbi:DgyrCDS8875 [Dimorphilus gyrociliatus]|uniref:DgyrCDS8875 n=1 Tax=Dimorphilus gyrociliatus TaxID=2664684 RepID=A0A7I8VVP4_9ANNE|nr:DgyrCDS8875 [Dimorphilus gyrociliatus]